MRLGHRIAYLLTAAVLLIHTAHAAPVAAEEMLAVSSAAFEETAAQETGVAHRRLDQERGHAPECVDPERVCGSMLGAAAPAHPFQPGAMPPPDRVALSPAVPAVPSRVVPRATLPLSILFRNFRS